MRFHQVFSWLCCLSVLQLVTPFAIDSPSWRKRGIERGWALAQSSCPTDTKSCGDGSCCPSNLFCFEHANMEVAACCPTSEEILKDLYTVPLANIAIQITNAVATSNPIPSVPTANGLNGLGLMETASVVSLAVKVFIELRTG